MIWTNGRILSFSVTSCTVWHKWPLKILQVQNIKRRRPNRQEKWEKTRILDLMWPVTSYFSALCFKGASNYQPPNKELAKQSGLFSRDLDPRHRCYHLTSTFGEDCQACTCASVLFVLPNGSMTMSTGHKRGCNINEPHLFPCSASAIPHVQELND